MKTKSLLQLSGIFMMITLVLSSCNSSIEISKRRHSKGYYVSIGSDSHKAKSQKATELNNAATSKKEEAKVAVEETEATVTTESSDVAVAPAAKTENTEVSTATTTVTAGKTVTDKVAKQSKGSKLKKAIQLKKALKKNKLEDNTDVALLLLVILAIILPPVAVYMVKGLEAHFWISILLTLLFWLPGVIHALLVVFGAI